jgi:dihydrofolate synthase/folylpolyglutamate synthase
MDIETAYNASLDYLYSFVDYSLKHTSELVKAEFNLSRMRELMNLLGDPQQNYPTLHVAGTKGKGSTSAFMASALKEAGYRTGLYISPHLQDFCERMQVNGEPIGHGELVDLVEGIKPAVSRIPFITTFELTTALAFLYFSKRKVEAAVIEVGLGGRLDATNIITPIVSVITSLSMDHMAVLGNTLPLIAREKAGIIKLGVPVVSSPQKEEALKVLEEIASECSSPFYLVGKDWQYSRGEGTLTGQDMYVWQKNGERKKLRLKLLGGHQVQNAVTAYVGLQVARAYGLKISEKHIRQGFLKTFWPARFEIVCKNPPVIFDSAHNQDSAIKLHETLNEYFPGKKIILIFGASEDKDVTAMFSEWKSSISKIITTRADHPRALDPQDLAEMAMKLGIESEAVCPVQAALEKALKISDRTGEIVLSAGSMFVTAEVRTAWQKGDYIK